MRETYEQYIKRTDMLGKQGLLEGEDYDKYIERLKIKEEMDKKNRKDKRNRRKRIRTI